MNNNLKKIALAGCVALGLSASGAALATGSHDCGNGGTSNPDCYSWKFNGSAVDNTKSVDASAQAWSNSGTGSALQTAYLGTYSVGLGVTNSGESGSSPNHATDNSGYVDSVLFSFSEAVNLDSMQVGWVGNNANNSYYDDSDFTVMAYMGTGSPVMAGETYSDLLSNGWKLVGAGTPGYGNGSGDAGHYDGGKSEGTRNFANDIFSSYWLIGALNAQLGANGSNSGNDYFKILALAGCDCTKTPDAVGCRESEVPEPGTLLLLGAGLFGLSRFSARHPLRFAA